MAYFELKCGASFNREDVAEMEEHVRTCSACILRRSGIFPLPPIERHPEESDAVIADRRAWESMHLGNWTFEAKHQRETVEKMLRRGEISEARAQELLREVKDAD